MSRAFTREDDGGAEIAGLGNRPVSAHRNLVTRRGLTAIDGEIGALRQSFGEAEAAADRGAMARISRDLRYWTARRETAELSEPEAGSAQVRFGMRVEIEDEEGQARRWSIVGEDEADAGRGLISHVSPMARALFGKGVGDTVTVAGKEWEIVGLSSERDG